MQIIITMAGLGSRFRKAGYTIPKYMIKAKNKTLFEWSIMSLKDYKSYTTKYIFIVRLEDNARDFIKYECSKLGIKNMEIIELDYTTDGQATSCMEAIPFCNEEESIMIYNIDTYVEPGTLKYDEIKGDGYLPCFNAPGEHWSFAKLDDNGKVIELAEKERISDNCTLGAYYFSSAKLYKKLYIEYYKDNKNMKNNEKYIAPMYNYLIKYNKDVQISLIDYKDVHVLGTPEELDKFINEE